MPNQAPNRLNRLLIEEGWSLRGFAEAVGASYEAVRTWKDGTRKPHRRYYRRLEAVSRMPIYELLAPAPDNDETAALPGTAASN